MIASNTSFHWIYIAPGSFHARRNARKEESKTVTIENIWLVKLKGSVRIMRGAVETVGER